METRVVTQFYFATESQRRRGRGGREWDLGIVGFKDGEWEKRGENVKHSTLDVQRGTSAPYRAPKRACHGVATCHGVAKRRRKRRRKRSRRILRRCTRNNARHPRASRERIILLSVATSQTFAHYVTHA